MTDSGYIWVRLVFGGVKQRWHAYLPFTDFALCGTQSNEYPRNERSADLPTVGKVCKRCLVKINASDRIDS